MYCEIRGLLGKSASEIKSDLDTVYRENTLPYRTVARRVSYFKEGRSSVKDEVRPGRPVLATSENDVATLQSIVQHDWRYSVEEISDLSGLSLPYVFTILKEKLKLQRLVDTLDTPSADPWTKEGSCGKGLCFAI